MRCCRRAVQTALSTGCTFRSSSSTSTRLRKYLPEANGRPSPLGASWGGLLGPPYATYAGGSDPRRSYAAYGEPPSGAQATLRVVQERPEPSAGPGRQLGRCAHTGRRALSTHGRT